MSDKVKKSAFSEFLESILYIKDDELRLKFIFDNLRNYGIAGGVFYFGLHLIKNGSLILNFIPYLGFVLGIFLTVSAFLLMCLNLVQGILATTKSKPKMLPYLVFNIIVTLSLLDYFWFSIGGF